MDRHPGVIELRAVDAYGFDRLAISHRGTPRVVDWLRSTLRLHRLLCYRF